MKDTRNERITQLYEERARGDEKYRSCIEYDSCEIHNPITLTHLSSYGWMLQSKINNYDCCIDDAERAKVGMEILYLCRNLGRYDSIAKEQRDEH